MRLSDFTHDVQTQVTQTGLLEAEESLDGSSVIIMKQQTDSESVSEQHSEPDLVSLQVLPGQRSTS